MVRLPSLLALTLMAPGLAAVAVPFVHLPPGERPAVLDALELPAEGLLALALAPDGRRAAVAFVAGEGRETGSTVRIFEIDGPGPQEVSLRGLVRALLFVNESRDLFAVEHVPAKRAEGDSFLVRIEGERHKVRRELRLPPTAVALEHWEGGRALLVAARNELRTITLPELRSGALYRVPGPNLALAHLGGTRMLVGQGDAILVIDLADPQQRDSIPIRQRLACPAAVLALAVAADGSTGLARLEDDRVFRLDFTPLALTEVGSGIVLSPPACSAERRPELEPAEPTASTVPEAPPRAEAPTLGHPLPAPAALAAPPLGPAEPEPVEPVDSGGPVPAASTAPAERPHGEPPRTAWRPAPTPATEGPAEPQPADPLSVEPADAGPARPRAVQLRGRIDGAAAGGVVAVVLFGPDNLLREALRVVPGRDGRYEAGGLAPGSYRVQLDGGGKRVLLGRPSFHTVRIAEDAVAVADFTVLRAL